MLRLLWEGDPPQYRGMAHHITPVAVCLSPASATPPSSPGHPSSAQISPPTADNALNPSPAHPGLLAGQGFPPCPSTHVPRQARRFVPGEGSTLVQTVGAGWAGRWALGWLWHHAVPDPLVDIMCIHSANITGPGCTSCCHDSPNTWPWARLLPLPSFCLPPYLSCLIR